MGGLCCTASEPAEVVSCPRILDVPPGETIRSGYLWFKQREKFKKQYFIRLIKPEAEPGMTQEEADQLLVLVALEDSRQDAKLKSTLTLRKCFYADTAQHVIGKYDPEFALTIKTETMIWELRAEAHDVLRGWFDAIHSKIVGFIKPIYAGFLMASVDKPGHYRSMMFRLLPTDKNGFSPFLSFASTIDETPIHKFFVANMPNSEKTALARLLDDQQDNERRGFDPSSTTSEFAFEVHLMYEPNEQGGYLSQKRIAFRAASREDSRSWISAILKASNAARGNQLNQAFNGTQGLTAGRVEDVFSASDIDIDVDSVDNERKKMIDTPTKPKWRKSASSRGLSGLGKRGSKVDTKQQRSKGSRNSGFDTKHGPGRFTSSTGSDPVPPMPPPPIRAPRDERDDSYSTIMSAPDNNPASPTNHTPGKSISDLRVVVGKSGRNSRLFRPHSPAPFPSMKLAKAKNPQRRKTGAMVMIPDMLPEDVKMWTEDDVLVWANAQPLLARRPDVIKRLKDNGVDGDMILTFENEGDIERADLGEDFEDNVALMHAISTLKSVVQPAPNEKSMSSKTKPASLAGSIGGQSLQD